MVAAALVISIVALLASALCALTVMELVATRASAAPDPADDTIEEFEVPPEVARTRASSHGLPELIDSADRHLVLVVSPMCARCAGMVSSLQGRVPEGLTVVVTASAPERMRAWIRDHGLDTGDVVFDDEMSIVNSLGVSSSPTGVGFGGGEVLFIVGVGGPVALSDLLEQRSTEMSAEVVAELLGRDAESSR